MAIGRRRRSMSMAISPCFSFNLSLLITLVIISHMILVTNGKSQSCTFQACRANVANECCCEAIRDEIINQGCSSLCTSFRYYDTPRLVSKCHENWKCVVCNECRSCKA